jgi:glycosyltransferase involved in cell wall biosynthesis
MDYDVVIATRNRIEALKLSIPLILRQSRKPNQLIIVDSSEDYEVVRKTVTHAAADFSDTIKILHTKPNSAHQRNFGLEYVKAPVVMFPDDDSLWWPGVAEAVMRIYERDKNNDIGAVCGRETTVPPPSVHLDDGKIYKMTLTDCIRQKIGGLRHKFDDRFCPDPLWIHGRSQWNVQPFPKWLHNIDSARVEFMGGFRMSFRTELIRKYGFDEDLGTYVGYAAYEDADASFKVLQEKIIVGAHDAHVYHYKAPNKRAKGFELGFILLFNRAYIICCYSPPGSLTRLMLKRFALYKMSQYMLGIGTKFGRERIRGTLTALKSLDELLNCAADNLREKYLEICAKALNQSNHNSKP